MNRSPSFVAALAFAALLQPWARGDIHDYAVQRVVSYTQASDAQPAAPEVWNFMAFLVSEVPDEVLWATLSFDVPPRVAYSMDMSLPTLQQYGSTLYYDYAQFMLDYPATTYSIEVDRGAGPESGDVYLDEDLYCTEVPYLTGTTFSRLQNCDASLAFSGSVNGFTLAAGTDLGYATITVVQDGVGAVWGVTLEPGETDFEIPAATLLPATGYSIGITYLNWVHVENAGFGAATSGAEFVRATGAVFTTIAPICPADFDGDGTVDFFDYDAFVICFEDPDCGRADFDGDGSVDFFDYDAFVVAFETPC